MEMVHIKYVTIQAKIPLAAINGIHGNFPMLITMCIWTCVLVQLAHLATTIKELNSCNEISYLKKVI